MGDKYKKLENSVLPDGTDKGEAVSTTLGWYAVYTRMHHERKAAQRLKGQGVDTYVPLQTVTRQWSDRLKKVEVVVIPTIFFIRIAPEQRLRVLKDPSVSYILSAPGDSKPTVIPNYQMEQFRFMVENADSPIEFESDSLVEGCRVRVIKGSLKGLEGTFLETRGRTKLFIKLKTLGNVSVVISPNEIELIK